MESFNVDIILSVYIHLQFSTFSKGKFLVALDYLAIIFLCFLVIGVVLLYVFMITTVHRLTKAYIEHSVIEIKDMPNERFTHWLSDKKPDGNFYQRNLNVLQLLKDAFNCTVLMTFYSNPIFVMIFVTAVQFAFTLLAIVCKPYQSRPQNTLLIIIESSYLILDILFISNIVGRKMSTQMRYYAMGFSMIGVVMLIIIASLAISTYQKYRDIINFFKVPSKVEPILAKPQIDSSKVSDSNNGDSELLDLEKRESQSAQVSPKHPQKKILETIKQAKRKTVTNAKSSKLTTKDQPKPATSPESLQSPAKEEVSEAAQEPQEASNNGSAASQDTLVSNFQNKRGSSLIGPSKIPQPSSRKDSKRTLEAPHEADRKASAGKISKIVSISSSKRP